MAPGLEATHYYLAPRATFASGVHVAVVEIDRETLKVNILEYAVVSDAESSLGHLPTIHFDGALDAAVITPGQLINCYGGTYTIGFETGEQVTGDFHTASCPGLATYLAATTHSCG